VYVQEVNGKKADRLHLRIPPELKHRFEEKVNNINFYLKEEDRQDMSAWVNRFINHFITTCDEFGGRMEKNSIDHKEFQGEFSRLFSIEQFLLLYGDYCQNSHKTFFQEEINKLTSSEDEKREKLESFKRLVDRLKEKE
jgi:hypothetical protein